MQQYIIQPYNSFFSIAQSFGLPMFELSIANPQVNDLDSILVGQVINIPDDEYTVKKGDTLYTIAQRFGLPLNTLLAANSQIHNVDYIIVGQKINIPRTQIPIKSPEQIDTIESNAEDMIDDINNNNWDGVSNKLNVIKTNLQELIPMLRANSIPMEFVNNVNDIINKLADDISTKNSYAAKIHANLITSYIPDLLDYYKTVIPNDVGRLDYLGREILLNVEGMDWDSAYKNWSKAKDIWENLKLKLNSMYNKDISDFDNILNNLQTSIKSNSVNDTSSNANSMLDEVDNLEKDFMQQAGTPNK